MSVLIKKILSGQEFNPTEVENLIFTNNDYTNTIDVIFLQSLNFFFDTGSKFCTTYALVQIPTKYISGGTMSQNEKGSVLKRWVLI